MTKNEQELIDIIRNSDEPGLAAVTAIGIICRYIRQREPSQEPPAADPLGSDEIVPT